MYIKAVGVLCVSMCGLLTGNAATMRLKERFERMDGIISSLSRIKAELVMNLTPVPDILLKLSKADDKLSTLFEKMYSEYDAENKAFYEIWQDSFFSYTAELGGETMQILNSVGAVLGKYDMQTQVNAIDYALIRLEKQLEELREEYIKQGSLYKKLGAALGIGISVMLM